MHIINTGGRNTLRKTDSPTCTMEDGSDAQQHDAYNQQRRFAALLRQPAARGTSAASERRRRDDVHFLMQAIASSPHFIVLPSSSRVAVDTLHLRLTNGPFAGLEIAAHSSGETLILRVRVNDLRRFEDTLGSHVQLTATLSELCKCPIIVEVQDAAITLD